MAGAQRFIRKRTDLFRLLNKLKLWPSRAGTLHGIRTFAQQGDYALVTTHCNHSITVRNSKNSRTARWLRNKWFFETCKECRIPQWKLVKFSESVFAKRHGSDCLTEHKTDRTG